MIHTTRKKAIMSIGMALLISLVFVLSMVTSVSAATQSSNGKLIVTDVEIEIDGKDSNVREEGSTVSKDAEPGDNVEFRITLLNNYSTTDPNEEDVEIAASVEIEIDGIEDDEDYEDDSDEEDIKAGKDEEFKFDYDIPLEVDSDDYTVTFTIEADDDLNNNHDFTFSFKFTVDKKTHDVRITRAEVLPESVGCNRNGVRLTAGVLNVGDKDEDDSELLITSPALDLNIRETFDLEEGAFDDDVKFNEDFVFDVPEDLKQGTYPITVKISYDDNDMSETETVNLIVDHCEDLEAEEEEEPEEEEEEQEEEPQQSVQDVDVVTPINTITQPTLPPQQSTNEPVDTSSQNEVEVEEEVEEGGLFSSNLFIALLIGFQVIVAIIIIMIIVRVSRK